MKKADQALVESCEDGSRAYTDINCSLRSLKSLVGNSGQGRRHKNLKRLGAAIILAPSPEPFTDIIGLALIGAGELGEHHKPPLTITEVGEETGNIFKDLLSSRHFTAKSSCWRL